MRVVWRSLDTAESINARLFCSCDQMGAIFQDLMNFFWFVDRSGCGMDTGMCAGDLTWFPTGSIGSFRDTSSPASRKAGSMQCRTRRTKTCGLLSEVCLLVYVCMYACFVRLGLLFSFCSVTSPRLPLLTFVLIRNIGFDKEIHQSFERPTGKSQVSSLWIHSSCQIIDASSFVVIDQRVFAQSGWQNTQGLHVSAPCLCVRARGGGTCFRDQEIACVLIMCDLFMNDVQGGPTWCQGCNIPLRLCRHYK